MEKTQPIYKERSGSCSVSVFENQYGKTAVIQKSYKKKGTDEWVNNNINIFLNEADNLLEILGKVKEKYPEDCKKREQKKE